MILYELDAINEQYFSPYCWRILMSLNHKDLYKGVKRIQVKFSDKSLISHKGFNTVPVLEDDDNWTGGSLKIAEYLEKTYPNQPSLFRGAENMNLTSIINQMLDTKIIGILARIIVGDVYKVLQPEDKIYFRETREKILNKTIEEVDLESSKYIPILQKELNPFRKVIRNNNFFTGSKPMYCDYILFGFFMWARNTSPKQLLEKNDVLWHWRERMLNLFDGFARKSNGFGIK
ncbi:MAG: glutathione S-transferase N-terminal domain-containing protein [Alphaproteobacteria bacterium]|jgi:glutathione S-transferase|nr:glutathione S-transferase N-terminal domain-containing protein [Alphaproteobacteria bacterium]